MGPLPRGPTTYKAGNEGLVCEKAVQMGRAVRDRKEEARSTDGTTQVDSHQALRADRTALEGGVIGRASQVADRQAVTQWG